MSIHTSYKFRHYRSLDPGDRAAPRELIWASGMGDVLEAVREGSRRDAEIQAEQAWLDNFLTDQGENDILDVFFRAGTAPTFFFALYNATPAETSDMTLAGEVTGTGYGRISVARNTTDWPTLALDAGDAKVTSVTKTFTATGTWTAATRLALVSTASGTTGRLYAIVALSATRTLVNGDTLQVSMGVKLS